MKDKLLRQQILPENLHNYFLENKYKEPQNKVLFKQGEMPVGIYYILEGSIKISKVYQKEKERVLKIAYPGDIFGLESFIDGYKYSATATVMEDSVICFMSKATLSEIIRHQPFICYNLLSKLYKYLLTSDKHIFLVSMSKVDEYLAEIEIEQKKFDVVHPIINHEEIDIQQATKLTGTSNKKERPKHKENYFQLKIKQLIC